ncbi:hypothetical protein CRUP_011219, partial [Coryphaenoides rupestris]
MADLDGGDDASPADSQASYSQETASSTPRRSSCASGQTYTVSLSTTTTTTTAATTITTSTSSPSNGTAPTYRADSLLYNKIDERQRLARERREEQEKQN